MKTQAPALALSFGLALGFGVTGCAGDDGGGGMGTDTLSTGDPTGSPTGSPTSDTNTTTTAGTTTDGTATNTTTDTTDTGGGPRPTCDNPGGGSVGNANVTSQADLDALAGIATVTGSLWIHDTTDITNLDPLICITSVGDELNLYNNDALTSVAGLDNVETVGGVVVISDNDILPVFDSLGKVYEVESWTMNDNAALSSVTGQDMLTVIKKHLVIQYNDVLSNISGLYNLQAIGGNLQVTNNPNLCVSQVNKIGAGLQQGPNLDGSSTKSNDDSC